MQHTEARAQGCNCWLEITVHTIGDGDLQYQIAIHTEKILEMPCLLVVFHVHLHGTKRHRPLDPFHDSTDITESTGLQQLTKSTLRVDTIRPADGARSAGAPRLLRTPNPLPEIGQAVIVLQAGPDGAQMASAHLLAGGGNALQIFPVTGSVVLVRPVVVRESRPLCGLQKLLGHGNEMRLSEPTALQQRAHQVLPQRQQALAAWSEPLGAASRPDVVLGISPHRSIGIVKQ
mmetsp:Transcript_73253/g.195359  ORF Transcript_73253/g.195359 Transcript_73253/m.195359 type:complete len:232 (-) Transcript_73253:355-1050(-)